MRHALRLAAAVLPLVATVADAAAHRGPPPYVGGPAKIPFVNTREWGGIVDMDAIARLTGAPVTLSDSAMPYAYGVVTNAAQWRAFAAIERGVAMASIDFRREAVLFVVLRANTNSLSIGDVLGDDAGNFTVRVLHRGIEPAYAHAMPVALLRVDRATMRKLHITVNNASLGDVVVN